jgi:hypothetical protein
LSAFRSSAIRLPIVRKVLAKLLPGLILKNKPVVPFLGTGILEITATHRIMNVLHVRTDIVKLL